MPCQVNLVQSQAEEVFARQCHEPYLSGHEKLSVKLDTLGDYSL